MKTTAKFNVAEITNYGNGGGTKVVLMPVTTGSEENKSFWNYTPSGRIEMHITNPDVKFELGEYFVDFTKAEQMKYILATTSESGDDYTYFIESSETPTIEEIKTLLDDMNIGYYLSQKKQSDNITIKQIALIK